ncbi:MAG TPA: NAD(P)-binding domain-containing protein [Acidimicrobiales bacterium]|nr:NAD(P)-binding domain-containing protein [Acidimicrobiales bacterium]
MRDVRTIIIGAGQAGLALSWHLTANGHDHVVVDRGDIAHRWRHQRWDSLRTLTPNWMSRLPGRSYQGGDPNGFMAATELAERLEHYATDFALPVETRTTVESVTRPDSRYRVVTDHDTLRSDNIVIATGWCDQPRVPHGAASLPHHVVQLTSDRYRNPAQVPDGSVLVVGASASGVQIADELQRAGRDVVIAVGNHTRVPRSYRGVDILGWLERMGDLDRGLDAPADPRVHEPSLQLSGRSDGEAVDLGTLQAIGVRLAGRFESITGDRLRFGDDLRSTLAGADARMRRLLGRIDSHIAAHDLLPARDREIIEAVTAGPTDNAIELGPRGVRSIVWATGFTRSYPWLHLPVFDRRGEIAQRRGVTALAGCYTMGMRFQTRRRSTFIDGARFDAAEIASHLLCVPRPTTARAFAAVAS